ncbi:hypothetical protein Poly59_61260 [Rubripirellula reticaptiva]|uniref:Uncharacterized protein n=1 Tax=Rubripirellula reticaptiva TaxID=2528013 RepID=A0A5C6E4I2_9BACT|nr:hypothetical protein Poly59_61260 [Rubripirellula reticaptiva]
MACNGAAVVSFSVCLHVVRRRPLTPTVIGLTSQVFDACTSDYCNARV